MTIWGHFRGGGTPFFVSVSLKIRALWYRPTPNPFFLLIASPPTGIFLTNLKAEILSPSPHICQTKEKEKLLVTPQIHWKISWFVKFGPHPPKMYGPPSPPRWLKSACKGQLRNCWGLLREDLRQQPMDLYAV